MREREGGRMKRFLFKQEILIFTKIIDQRNVIN